MPFDLHILDSKLAGAFADKLSIDPDASIVEVIVALCKKYLASTSVTSNAASECLGKLFSRKDIREKDYMVRFVDWTLEQIEANKDDQFQSFYQTGLHAALDQVFKLLAREDLLKIIPKVYSTLFKDDPYKDNYLMGVGTVRLNRTKLAQRMALTLLRPRECRWMHRRTKKSLLKNFQGQLDTSLIQTNVAVVATRNKGEEQTKEEEDEAGIDEDVDLDTLEGMLGIIFDSLKDKETTVRWSAAKAVGRITQRLDLELAGDIVNEIVDTFLHAGEHEWHGGLMALGELARRGLLLPANLSRVIHILKRGLIFEVAQGTYTTGSNVRDAACYVAWAFSRAFEPEIMQPYVHDLASSLLLCALFDKESQCRRAAAAAFQENVGRQGNFPRGIEIITEADYFSLGVRQNAYLRVGLFVAHYKEYFRPFVDHLAKVKLMHCDTDIRKLAAAALCLLTPMEPEFMITEILPHLVPLTTHVNHYVRHGAIMGIGEILVGLGGRSSDHILKDGMKDSIFLKSLTVNERKLIKPGEYMGQFLQQYEQIKGVSKIDIIPPELKKEILSIVEKLETKRLYRGKGGDQLRTSVCRFIACLGISKVKLSKLIHNKLMDTLEENIRNPLELVSKEAEAGLLHFSEVFHQKAVAEAEVCINRMIEKATTDSLISTKRGYTQGITAFAPEVLALKLDQILAVLEKNSEIIKKKGEDDPDLRNISVLGFKRLLQRLPRDVWTAKRAELVSNRLTYVMDDYTVDRRGDIGSLVREGGMYAWFQFLNLFTSSADPALDHPLNGELLVKIIGIFLQQLVEKIDRTRLVAGSILQAVFDRLGAKLPDFPHKEELTRLFSNSGLRERVKKDQDRVDVKFDISLIDTTFLDYDKNESLIYFWDQPQCVFPLAVPLITLREYSRYILRGLTLSLGGITASTSDGCVKAVDEFVNSQTTNRLQLAQDLLNDFISIMAQYRRVERFMTPILHSLAFFYKAGELLHHATLEPLHLKVVEVLCDELLSTKYSTKLEAGAEVFRGVLGALLSSSQRSQAENLEWLKQAKVLELMSHLLNHEFPVVAKKMSDVLFLALEAIGERLLPADKLEGLIEYISGKDWLQIDISKLPELKTAFEGYFSSN